MANGSAQAFRHYDWCSVCFTLGTQRAEDDEAQLWMREKTCKPKNALLLVLKFIIDANQGLDIRFGADQDAVVVRKCHSQVS